jgi:iron complex outermembrane receptor protein
MPRTRLLGLVLALHGVYAFAQSSGSQPPTQNSDLPPVVVTGSRFPEQLDPTAAIGTTVITGQDIRNSGAITVYDALRRLGGVQTRANLSGTPDDTIDLRGFGVTGDQNTLVLIDGVRVSENELQSARLSSVPLDSIDRIEIVRGSGAVLYGGGATGGVINVITKSARVGSKSLNAGVLAGSYGTTNYSTDGAIASGPLSFLGGNSVGLDFATNQYDSDNYRKNNAVAQQNISGRLRVIGSNGEAGVRVASERTHSQLPGALSIQNYQNDPRQANTPNDWADTDANRYTFYGNYRWRYVEIAADVYRRDKVDRFYNDFGSGGGSQFTRAGSGIDGLSPRLRITAPVFGLANQLVLGYDRSRWLYTNQQAFVGAGGASEGDLANGNLSSDEQGTQHNEAFYFKDDLNIGPVRLTAGARRETLKQSTFNSTGFSATGFTTNDRKLHAEELGVAWNFLKDWTVYAKGGNSYRIGNIDENRFRFPAPGFLLPQTSRDAEAGFSYASRPLDVDLRYFESRLENEIMFVPATVFPTNGANINLSPTKRDGAELTAKWRPRADFDLTAFYTYVRARFRSGTFGGADITGKDVPLAPRNRASLQANWRITPVDAVNLGWQYVGNQVYDNDQANTFGSRIPAYATIDAKYTRKIGNVDLSVIGTNLTNRGYFAYGVISGSGTGASNVYPERRRAIFVSAAAHF